MMPYRVGATLSLVLLLVFPPALHAQTTDSRNLAPGFDSLPKGSKVAIMPTDIELFSVSGGGVLEPKADWTEAASRFFREALLKKKQSLGLDSVEISERDADDLADVNALHGAVARSIGMHHFGMFKLPTKDGKLEWTLGESVQVVRKASSADYALFSWVRDSYASAERKAAMVALALVGVGIGGGMQVGYASLVDLKTGQVVWFNQIVRGSGDLREASSAAETLDSLLDKFPVAK
jgi:hypothetical protein